jgi:hypothetical protein
VNESKLLTNINYITVQHQAYRLIPQILTYEQYLETYEHFTAYIKASHKTLTEHLDISKNISDTYPDVLMWIEFINIEKIYTEEFIHTLDQIFSDPELETKDDNFKFNEFYQSLYLHYHFEFLDILKGKSYYLFKHILNIDLESVDITKYNWRWLVPYYTTIIPKLDQQGLIRMNHLSKFS